ncbi:hypothetical protein K501DRAFT_333146 [Backusella circina FSU 941]|nr:hypothetical protein K501DRAFT_333146 [Backusella circina FSU 941]
MPILQKILHPRRRSQLFYPGQLTEEQISEVIASKNFSNASKELSPPDLIDQMDHMSLIQESNTPYTSPVPIQYLGYSNDVLPTTDPPKKTSSVLERPRFTRQEASFVQGTSREDKTLVQENQAEGAQAKFNSSDEAKEMNFMRQQLALFELERLDWQKKIKLYQAREDQMRKEIQENQNQINQLRNQYFVDPNSDEQEQPSRHNSYQTVSTSSFTDENYFDTAGMMDDDEPSQRHLSYPNYYSAYYLQQWRNYYSGYR